MTLAQTLLAMGTGASFTALAVSLFVHREAVLDLRAVTKAGVRNGRRAVARRELEAETSRVIALLLFTIAAGASLSVSPPDYVAPLPRVIGLSAFILGQVVLAIDSVRALISRRKFLRGHGHHGKSGLP